MPDRTDVTNTDEWAEWAAQHQADNEARLDAAHAAHEAAKAQGEETWAKVETEFATDNEGPSWRR